MGHDHDNTSSNLIRELWKREYADRGIPSSFRTQPSGAVVTFVNFLKNINRVGGAALDIGCGTGRNSRHLVHQGFSVTSIDLVDGLIEDLKKTIAKEGLSSRLRAICHDIGTPWPLGSELFDVAIDTFCFKHLVAKPARDLYHAEVRRVLKPGAFFLITLADIADGYYGPLLKLSPAPVERLIIDPANGIGSILYSRTDLLAEFSDSFEEVKYIHKNPSEKMHGKVCARSTHVCILTKKRR